MIECVNVNTGEVKKCINASRVWVPVRDKERYEPGTSMTAPDEAESLESIIKRCQRDRIPVNVFSKESYYDDSDFGPQDEVDSPDFDLADVDSLVSGAPAPDVAEGNVAEPKEKEKSTDSETESNESSSQSIE